MSFQHVSDCTLEIQVEHLPEKTRVTLRGEVDSMGTNTLDFVAATVSTKKHMVVDLRHTSYFLPSVGVRFIQKVARRLMENKKECRVVVHEGSYIQRAFDILGVRQCIPNIHFELEPTKS